MPSNPPSFRLNKRSPIVHFAVVVHFAAFLITFATAFTTASAEPQVFVADRIEFQKQSDLRDLTAGPYAVRPSDFGFAPAGLGKNGTGADEFLTFSLLSNPQLRVGNNYNVSIQTDFNSNNKTTTSALDSRTAFLYTIFTNGTFEVTLTEFINNTERRAGAPVFDDATNGETIPGPAYTARDIQNTIWFIEGRLDRNITVRERALVALAEHHVYETDGYWFGQGLGDVRVMNVTGANYGVSEQLLVMIPLPVPAALILAGMLAVIGITMIGSAKRRHQGSSALF